MQIDVPCTTSDVISSNGQGQLLQKEEICQTMQE